MPTPRRQARGEHKLSGCQPLCVQPLSAFSFPLSEVWKGRQALCFQSYCGFDHIAGKLLRLLTDSPSLQVVCAGATPHDLQTFPR